MERVEKLARAMCVADGVDPDMLVCTGEPFRLPRGGYVAAEVRYPAWSTYVELADAVAALEGEEVD